jgi:hypothetical protein
MDFKVKKFESIRGPASVRVLKDSIQVRMLEDGEFHSAGQGFEFAKKDAPPIVLSDDALWVSMNKKGTALYSLSPVEGEYIARFAQWKGKENEVPEPRYNEGGKKITTKDGRAFVTSPSQSMDPISVIAEGKYKGLTVIAFIPYIFVPGDGGVATVEGTKGQVERVKDFFRATGLSNDRVPYEKNLLPTLGKLILEHGQHYHIKVANGMVVNFAPLPDGYRVGPAPARKAAAKSK